MNAILGIDDEFLAISVLLCAARLDILIFIDSSRARIA